MPLPLAPGDDVQIWVLLCGPALGTTIPAARVLRTKSVKPRIVVVIAVVAATFSAPAWASVSAVTFGGATSHAVGDAPSSVAIGDLNGDGKWDLVTANVNSDNVSVRLGNGNGTFATAASHSVGDQPYSVALGDLNGDGASDIVAANFNSDTVSVRIGNGSGAFSLAHYGVGDGPRSVAIGDLNADGKRDLVTANDNSDNVTVRWGNGDGTFPSSTNYAIGDQPKSVAVGDLNDDGKPDFATALAGPRAVAIRLGNGDKTFVNPGNIAVGTYPSSVTMGDLDDDDELDLVTTDRQDQAVSVLMGDGDGTFSSAKRYTVGTGPDSAAIDDLNNDGKLDLVVANYIVGTVSVLLGDGDGTFALGTSYAVGNGAISAAIRDVNNDGRPDIATAVYNADSVKLLLNTSLPGFSEGPTASITGVAQVGSTLTAEAGSTVPAPDGLTYQWFVDGEVIGGATTSTLALTAAHQDRQVRVRVTASKSGYADTSDTSASTGAVAGATFIQGPVATILGMAKVGSTVSAETGSVTPVPDSFDFQWFADGVPIGGANAKTLGLAAEQEGKRVKVTVTVRKAGYTSSASTSTETEPVVPGELTTTSQPTIDRAPSVGVTSNATTGTWTPTPSDFQYQWLANGVAISGATGASYMPTSSMLGKRISVQVTASRPGYTSASATSAEGGPVTSSVIAISAFDPMTGSFYPYLRDGYRDVQTAKVRFNRQAAHRFQVLDAAGREVRRSPGFTAASGEWRWDGRKNDGRVAPVGAYRFKVTAIADGRSATRTSAAFYLKPGPVTVSRITLGSGSIQPFVRDGIRDYQEVRFTISTPATYRVKVLNSSGSVVFQSSAYKDAGRTWYWRGRTNSGAKVPNGKYRVVIAGSGAGQAISKTSTFFSVVSGYTWIVASSATRGGDAGTPSTSGACYIDRNEGEPGYYDEYVYYDPWTDTWQGEWVEGTPGFAEIDCWGGTGVMTYGFHVPGGAEKFGFSMAGEWSDADLCCDGSVTKGGSRASSTAYRVYVKVTGLRAWIVHSVSLKSYAKKYY